MTRPALRVIAGHVDPTAGTRAALTPLPPLTPEVRAAASRYLDIADDVEALVAAGDALPPGTELCSSGCMRVPRDDVAGWVIKVTCTTHAVLPEAARLAAFLRPHLDPRSAAGLEEPDLRVLDGGEES